MDTRESMTEKLIAMTKEDTDFRVRLLAKPNLALKEAFDIDLPDEFNVVVHEDDARTANIVLPASSELSDEQLQLVAAGDDDDWGHFG